MAHLIKTKKQAPAFIPARASRGERDLRRMAAMVKNEDQLEAILSQTRPEMREACRARIAPLLRFQLSSPRSNPAT